MMKKNYQKPAMQAVRIQQHGIICTSPGVSSLSNEEGFDFPSTPLDSDIDDV